MLVNDLLPQLRELSRVDKLQVMYFLVLELAKEEGVTLVNEAYATAWALHNSHEAAHQLAKLLEQEKDSPNV